MDTDQRRRQPLVVARQAAEARHPHQTALNHPAPRQQDKAALGRGQLVPIHERAALELKELARQRAADPRPPQHGMDADYLRWAQRDYQRQGRRRKWEALLP